MAKKSKKQHQQQQGGTPATVALTSAGVPYTIHAYDHDPSHPSYGEEAAEAMGVSPDRVFKTLVADVDGTLTVAVVPVAGQLDLKALASATGGKRATMADPTLAERTTGYVRGGISPLGQRKKLPTVLDASAATHPTICISAGRRGLEVELSPEDLTRLTQAVVAAIGRA
jgi:Cys-tRNA(Pro)/Cys-tRNA(Cys) deacylase